MSKKREWRMIWEKEMHMRAYKSGKMVSGIWLLQNVVIQNECGDLC